jgi:hypothetical protein
LRAPLVVESPGLPAPERGTTSAFREESENGPVKVQLLCFDDCPNWELADERIRRALDVVGSTAEVERVLVETPEDAQAWHFHGSPSILVDGVDPFAAPDAPVGLSCRVYRSADGVVEGAPTVDQLVAVLCA